MEAAPMGIGIVMILGLVVVVTAIVGVIVAVVLVASSRGRDERDH